MRLDRFDNRAFDRGASPFREGCWWVMRSLLFAPWFPVPSDPKPRPYDLPWVVMDSSRAEKMWGWKVQTRMDQIFEEIADG